MSDITTYDPNNENYINSTLLQLKKIKENSSGLFKGVVRTILDGKIQDDLISNIVTGTGRIFTSQKLFNTRHFSNDDYTDYTVSHFGFGQGGAVISGKTASIISPDCCDYDLHSPIALSDTDFLTSPGDLNRNIIPKDHAVKPIGANITMLESTDLTCSYGSINTYVRCNCVKNIGEPNYLVNDTDYILINECGLYYTNMIDTHLFAHICFPPQYIQKKSEFVIEWYILC